MLGMRRVGKRIAQQLFVEPNQEDLRRTFIRRWARNDKQAYLWSMDAMMRWSLADRLGTSMRPSRSARLHRIMASIDQR